MGRTHRVRTESEGRPPKRTRRRHIMRRMSSRTRRDKLLGGELDGRRSIVTDEEFRENISALVVDTVGEALQVVESLDLRITDNRQSHHTEEYEQKGLIVRRGQAFSVAVNFDRTIDSENDTFIVQLAYGARPQESKQTLIRLPINLSGPTEKSTSGWVAIAKEMNDTSLTIELTSAPDSMVGKYEIYIETKSSERSEDFSRYDADVYLYVLFNPWCKEDVVYMEDEDERFEYVLNDLGRIWIGSKNKRDGIPWNFGQFEPPVLDVALDLLDKGELSDIARMNVVCVVRCLSALANSVDDDGLLKGRWSNDFRKGTTKPWEWTGSVAIIEEFHRTGKPVCYGQCWVFSAVITSLLRSLGVPTRSVTNFESAHDTDCSMTIDLHFNEKGEPLEKLNDSIWNFHVWNESYFRRLDLPEGYDGWQAHDATPQELSEGVMRCGPASLKAIKEGHVYLSYDTGFIFAEVNGDKVEWLVRKDGSMTVCNIDRRSVGRFISTKAVGNNGRHDLTLDYKYADGSEEERKVLEFVNRFSSKHKQNIYGLDRQKELAFDLLLPSSNIGDDLNLGVKIVNMSSDKRTVSVCLTLVTSFYTDIVGKRVKSHTTKITMDGNEEKEVVMSVKAEDYEAVMNPQACFKFTASCWIIKTDNLFAKSESFFLIKPALAFEKVPEVIPTLTKMTVKLTLKNTSNINLHNCVFHVEGSYIVQAKTYNIRKIVHPDDTVSVDVALHARKCGARIILAAFSSDEITGIRGEVTVNVVSKSMLKTSDNLETREHTTEKPAVVEKSVVAQDPMAAVHPTAAEKPVATAEKPVAAAEKPVAAAEKPVAAAEKPVTTLEEPVTTAEEPVATAEKPVAAAEKPVATDKPMAAEALAMESNGVVSVAGMSVDNGGGDRELNKPSMEPADRGRNAEASE